MKRFLLLPGVFVSIVLLLPVLLYKTGFFIVNEPVKSNILIVEGWMSSHAIDHPPFDYNDFDTIFVVGVKRNENWDVVEEKRQNNPSKNPKDYLRLATNGYVFLRGYERKNIKDSIFSIRIIAKGSSAEGEFAHFFVLVKDSLIGHSYVSEKTDTFTFKVKIPKTKIADLNLYFHNDRQTEDEDRNLEIYSVILDTLSFLPEKDECFCIWKTLTSTIQNNANYLAKQPNLRAKIIVVDTLFKRVNNTYTSAKAFNRYLQKNNLSLNSINIYTYPTHSRRTRLAYKKALPKNITIGTYVTNTENIESNIHWYIASLDETIRWTGTLFLPQSSD